ncbi:sugar phosphate isomerase/epimerase family protein [Cerasicoccus fimbriatus]|uniref:sugar phosphate isomerase/epimerase family protein n=1 Tax=Cerasicoccus fimbriatus TaxID=3014554 RepID=UPI0022B4ED26|nr:hypothetical protein [Cerasicoccus sp. TK19100]
MDLIFAKSKWEMWDAPLDDFLRRAKADAFDAVEIFLPAQPESASEIAQQVADEGLLLIAQITTEGNSVSEHLDTLRERFSFAIETSPLFVNSHSGCDVFSFDENCEIFQLASSLAEEANVLITHETHRGRPLNNGPETRRYLETIPQLRLNADFSHWFCVHESDLRNQEENVEMAVQRSSHVHARVGFSEGPQVPDPLSPLYAEWTDRHVELWKRILRARHMAGDAYITITPEFGPPPYMPVEPLSGRPIADAWEVNVRFKDYLKSVLRVIDIVV